MELDSLVTIGGAVPFIVAFTQLFKTFIKDDKWIPLISIGIGITLATLAGWALGNSTPTEYVTSLFNGLVAGLTASGIYSGGKALTK
jgi:uncharacterized protein YqfA (UPF0365 family)